MTSNYEHDAFEIQFEDAVRKAHKRKERGDEPSARVWSSIRSQLGNPSQAEAADPRAIGRDHGVVRATNVRNTSMDATLMPRRFGEMEKPTRRFGWMTLLAAGLVGLMIVTSFWMNGSTPPPDDRDDIAWAPGIGTPQSSPVASNACTVEPLTTDEVMDMVLNPNRGYTRLGMARIPQSDSLWEPEEGYLLDQMPSEPQSREEAENPLFQPATGETASELETIGNQYWTCLQEGTALQAWAILDPVLVQQTILLNFPVIRTESNLRAYIQNEGTRPFVDVEAGRFSSLTTFASGDNAEAVESFVFETENVGDQTISFASVHLASADDPSFIYKLFIREVAPGVWVIYEMSPQTA